jgi:hypothetical protein
MLTTICQIKRQHLSKHFDGKYEVYTNSSVCPQTRCGHLRNLAMATWWETEQKDQHPWQAPIHREKERTTNQAWVSSCLHPTCPT